ncbi:acetyl-CoA hydrolase/transferase family protein [Allopusillimonas soli]|uniref:Acetyl-CoA hydrolase/transferase family protein n=1 Tax=Allopusillimonas soli TaxID=659016 RepID=A0A853FAR9_9BURK|nr:acetyl-CoA hydrolase/transferase family protein [Allopusillimonas soli]NYT37825.1 acetyl-CoA hydrolase/transferase family protein [Allopusillimonas soli]
MTLAHVTPACADQLRTLSADQLDLRRFIRPGDTILWGQGPAEPLALSRAVVRQRHALGGCRVFVGPSYCGTLRPGGVDGLALQSYCGIGDNSALISDGLMDVIPVHCSTIPRLIDEGLLACDVVFLHLSEPGPDGKCSPGIANDYLLEAARRARVVIAQVNARMPWTYCGEDALDGIRIDAVVPVDDALPELPSAPAGETEKRIARHACAFIPDGAVLETGIGAIPDAILGGLRGHRDLGIHSGMISDGVVDLIECGTVTNARKTRDRGLTVTAVMFGTERLYRHAQGNPGYRLHPYRYTHDIGTLADLDRFVAINSAVEVDLTGQVNGEVANGRYVGAVGGQLDFIRGALRSRGGRSIIALPSTARRASVSRIVCQLTQDVVTSPRADADIIVTEWGAAQLRGQPLAERARRMIAIAHPDHRAGLEAALRAARPTFFQDGNRA